eukprot:m.273541 g.273541  ORF g.273541 m.273541 type:complete len:185 (-) comp54820_c1_seq5:1754-2308(-)
MAPFDSENQALSEYVACDRGWLRDLTAVEHCEHILIQPVLGVLEKADFKSRKEAAAAIATLCLAATPQQMRYVMQVGAMTPLVQMLKFRDLKISLVILEALFRVLSLGSSDNPQETNAFLALFEEAGGIRFSMIMADHENTQLAEKAQRLLDSFFPEEEVEDYPAEGLQFDFSTDFNPMPFYSL